MENQRGSCFLQRCHLRWVQCRLQLDSKATKWWFFFSTVLSSEGIGVKDLSAEMQERERVPETERYIGQGRWDKRRGKSWDFSGSPEVTTLYFHCKGYRFYHWGAKIPYAAMCSWNKNMKKGGLVIYDESVDLIYMRLNYVRLNRAKKELKQGTGGLDKEKLKMHRE